MPMGLAPAQIVIPSRRAGPPIAAWTRASGIRRIRLVFLRGTSPPRRSSCRRGGVEHDDPQSRPPGRRSTAITFQQVFGSEAPSSVAQAGRPARLPGLELPAPRGRRTRRSDHAKLYAPGAGPGSDHPGHATMPSRIAGSARPPTRPWPNRSFVHAGTANGQREQRWLPRPASPTGTCRRSSTCSHAMGRSWGVYSDTLATVP